MIVVAIWDQHLQSFLNVMWLPLLKKLK
uniref:Uncharacterized protein n=1 Tax=Anguilla anguilla TaxID=7936 RepID=A0A0E9QT10_ANGAN